MTLAAQRILVIGGGFAGMSAAIELRKRGADVDLVEIDPGWRNCGTGISLAGATLRAFQQLVLEEMDKLRRPEAERPVDARHVYITYRQLVQPKPKPPREE